MSLFGWSIIRTEDLKEMKESHVRIKRLFEVYRVFSGWKDLDIIWDYIFTSAYWGGIYNCRSKYASARDTDEHGKVLK